MTWQALSFHDLYERYAPEVYRFSFWLSGNAADAEDITSETFIRAWTGSERIRTETVKAYLFTIARNLYLKQLRQSKRQVDLDANHASLGSNPAELVGQRMELTAVLQQLQKLPEVDRAALILRVQYELPYAEIARVLNLSLANAKVKVHRARLKLAAARTETEVNEYDRNS